MAKAKTLTVDSEVYAALEERAAQAGMSVDTMVQRILRQELGFTQETRPVIREVSEPILVGAYEAAWMEVHDAGAHDFRTATPRLNFEPSEPGRRNIGQMGLYDTVRCRFPLPHHQDAEYQTKDLEHLVGGVSDLGGTMSEYEITPEGGLRVRVHQREWYEDPDALAGGNLKSVNDWWEDIPDVHGDIRIYTLESGERIEYRIRFTDGAVSRVDEVERTTTRPDSG